MCELKQIKITFFKMHFKCSNIGWGAGTLPHLLSAEVEKMQKTLEAIPNHSNTYLKLSYRLPLYNIDM